MVRLGRAGRNGELREKGITMSISEALRIVKLENGPDEYEFHLTAVSIGDIVFAGLPGEPFVEIGKRIIADSPFETTIILALTDGGEIYFPTGDIYEEGGYEAECHLEYGHKGPFKKGINQSLTHGFENSLKRILSE